MSDQERLDRLEAEGLKMHTPEFERQIAETMAEREVPAWKLLLAAQRAEGRAERRERIAVAIATAIAGNPSTNVDALDKDLGFMASLIADDLVNRLDAAEARDREATA